jgi:hypothetical protein
MRLLPLLLLSAAAVLLASPAASALRMATLASDTCAAGNVNTQGPCRFPKICCANLDFGKGSGAAASDPFRCYNLQTSDDHCSSCAVQCSGTAFRRCVNGLCTARLATMPLSRQDRDCNGNPTTGAFPQVGSVEWLASPGAAGTITANIVLNPGNALHPGQLYDIYLIQVGATPTDCFTPDAAVVLQPDGSLQVTVSEARRPGATAVFAVILHNDAPRDVFLSAPTPLPPV